MNSSKYIFVLYFALIFSVSLLIFISCNKPSPSILEGEWEDVSPHTLLGGERYTFSFKEKSFEIKKYMYSDVSISKCNQTGSQNNYYVGDFNLVGDSLHLIGKLFKSTYLDSTETERLVPDCMNTYDKDWEYTYFYSYKGDTLKLRPRENFHYGSNDYNENDSVGRKILSILTIYLRKSL